MLGAYYATKYVEPVHGLQGLGQTQQNMTTFASEQMQVMLASVQPLGIYVPWADQIGETDWKVVAPETRYALYQVTATSLDAAERAAFGQPVGFVVVLTDKQLSLATAGLIFNGTPFEYFSTDAVYRTDDSKAVPTIYFAYWGRLRDAPQRVGTYDKLEAQTQAAGGRLAFPIYAPVPSGAMQPQIDFKMALRQQQLSQAAPEAAPSAAAPAPTAPAPMAPAAAAAATGGGQLILLLAVGGVAAYVGYRLMQGR